MARPPREIGEYLEQLREPITRSTGATDTERYLAHLADRTFLDLWSYPNPFRDQKPNAGTDGKELCDLLVVCDPHVIIFSEKNIGWQEGKPTEVAWPRWFRRAVLASADQLKGAERWLNDFPNRVFVDRACRVRLPLELPPASRRRTHRVLVARGAENAGKAYFEGGTGSLLVVPKIKSDAHLERPFAIGDVDPEQDFVHVFDAAALDAVIHELDTVSDLTRYLDRRALYLRSGFLNLAHGEEDLLAYYLVRTDDEGLHDFVPPDGNSWADFGPISLDGSHYRGLLKEPKYVAKKRADEVSYVWDRLIEAFTTHLLGGTSIVLDGFDYSLTKSEIGLRHMAMQTRVERRNLSQAFLTALREGQGRQVFCRIVVTNPDDPSGTAFFFLTLKYADWMDATGGYEQYRQVRAVYGQLYAEAILMKHRSVDRVIGISMEPPGQGRGASEDCIYVEQTDWTDNARRQNRERCSQLGIMRRDMKETRFHEVEYPEPESRVAASPSDGMNRRTRRKNAAISRKKG